MTINTFWRGLLAASAALALAACNSKPAEVDTSPESHAMLLDSADGADWPGYGRSYGEQHYSPLSLINDGNVADLGLAWFLDIDTRNPATQPIAVNGVIYVSHGLSIVQAVDALTGKVKWTFDPEVGKAAGQKMRVSWGNRGIAWWNGKVYTGTADGRLIAINAETGQQVWSAQTTKPGDGRFITGAPRVFEGRIIIGHGGADSLDVRGYVTTYNAETGDELWRFFLVPGNPADGFEDEAQEMAAKTWTGEWWKYGGGGTAWNSFAYDPETATIMIGTGNGAPWNQKIRSPEGGDNLFLVSLVALDARTGTYKWHYQFNPGETWDYNSAMDLEFGDLEIDGQMRKVVMTAPKNGFFYVLDRTNGKLISAEKIARVTWASHIDLATGRPVENPAARYLDGKPVDVWPSFTGAHSWMKMSFSPQSRLAYIPKLENGATYSDEGIDLKGWKRAPGNVPGLGVNITFENEDPLHATSSLLAWDPVTQTKAWEIKTIGGWNGGIMATGGNLVFQGQLDGRFSAYSAREGKELWQFDAHNAILAAPISYLVNGEQYVTLMVGMGTSTASNASTHGGLTFDYRTQPRRMMTFKLGGSAKLPPKPAPYVAKAFDDPGFAPDAAQVTAGYAVYAQHCIICHGMNAVAGGGAPDLRTTPSVLDEGTFDQIVREGMLEPQGMPRYPELTKQQMADMRHYLRARAADLRAGRK